MAEAPQDFQKEQKAQENLDEIPEADRRTADTPKINGTSTTSGPARTTTHDLKRHRTRSDPDAQDMVIASLRSQIQDLFSQVTQLNTKLVNSYDRVSDLEDDLHVASATVRSSTLKISQLELERTQHLSALNTGLLVEKSHVTSELNRLMEKATEEAAQRGQAESARRDIEKDLDDLSATLFGQANTMVAEARFAQHLSEQKVAEAERALKGAEEAVGVMQQQMQALQSEKEEAEERAEKALVAMGKGKHTERRESPTLSIRLLSSHLPYQEFLLFVAHLRSIHISSPQPPAITTLLPQPFLARLLNEDSEPTVRLDLAPSLNWLSRRSVLAAIHNGQLIIEPMSSATLLQETGTSVLNSSSNNISCALCGTLIFSTTPEGSHTHSRPTPPILGQSNSNSMSWSASLFKKPAHSTSYSVSSNNSQPPTPPRSSTQYQQISPPQVYIFRLASQTSTTSSIPIPALSRVSSSPASSSSTPQQSTDNVTQHSSSTTSQSSSTIYPLCSNAWCLSRLRATCTIWAFVRAGIVEKVWEEEVPTLLPPTIATSPTAEKPPVPPRRRGLWGMASALGERATSWGGEGDKDKAKKAAPAAPAEAKPIAPRRLPPPLPPIHSTAKEADAPVRHNAPPPLPKRSEVRHQASSAGKPLTQSTPATQETAPTAEEPSPTPAHKEPALPPRPPRRPITPASVPLPDSRPPTPSVAPASAPTAIATGSHVPPPLPRRAAARMSRVIADGAVPRPATPQEPITESKEDSAATTKVEPTHTKTEAEPTTASLGDSNGTSENSEEGSASTPGGEPAPSADALLAPDESSENAVSEVVFSSEVPEGEPSTEASAVVEPVAEREGGNGEEADVQAVENGPETKEVNGGADSSVEGVSAATTSAEEVLPPPTGVEAEEEEALGQSEKEKKDDEEAAVEEEKESLVLEVESEEGSVVLTRDAKSVGQSETKDDKEVYIGDTTWEERTWKEIVRLKEEMFWARIGGLRLSE